MVPESFIPRRRFHALWVKSPAVDKTPINAPNPQNSKPNVAHATPAAATTPPAKPSHDLPGETDGHSLCLPNGFPTRYAPVSLAQIIHTKLKIGHGS